MQSASGDLGQYDRNAVPEKYGLSLQTVWRGLLAHSVRIAVPAFAPPAPRHQHCTHHASSEILLSTVDHADQSHLLSAERRQAIPPEQSTYSASRHLLVLYCLDHAPAPKLPPPIPASAQTAVRPHAIYDRENHHRLRCESEGPPHEIRHVPQEGSRIRPAAALDLQYQHADHAPSDVSSTFAPICLDSHQQTNRMSVHEADVAAQHRNPGADPAKLSLFAYPTLRSNRTRTQKLPYPLLHGRIRFPICLH